MTAALTACVYGHKIDPPVQPGERLWPCGCPARGAEPDSPNVLQSEGWAGSASPENERCAMSPTKPRTTRTPADKAEVALGYPVRKRDRIQVALDKVEATAMSLTADLHAAQIDLNYAIANPALKNGAVVVAPDEDEPPVLT